MTNTKPTEPGKYLYKMPHWSQPFIATVLEYGGELSVQFKHRFSPTRMTEIPADALWQKVED